MKIMVSACLLGDNVKYNGQNNYQEKLHKFLAGHEVIKVCPEVMGGLSIPRSPAEIKGNSVINQEGYDVTKEYHFGALKTLEIAKKEQIKVAILKKNSPSCSNKKIYDGTFTHTLVNGMGVTAQLLKENGITVLNEEEWEEYFKSYDE